MLKLIEWELFKPLNFITIVLIILIWQLMLAPIFMAIGNPPGDTGDSQ